MDVPEFLLLNILKWFTSVPGSPKEWESPVAVSKTSVKGSTFLVLYVIGSFYSYSDHFNMAADH